MFLSLYGANLIITGFVKESLNMSEDLKKELQSLHEENKKTGDLLKDRLYAIADSLHDCALTMLCIKKDNERLNDNLQAILDQLKRLETTFQKVSPHSILTTILSDWRVVVAIVCIASACGVDILSVLPDLKKLL